MRRKDPRSDEALFAKGFSTCEQETFLAETFFRFLQTRIPDFIICLFIYFSMLSFCFRYKSHCWLFVYPVWYHMENILGNNISSMWG